MTTPNPDERMPRPTASPRVSPVPIAALLMEFKRFQNDEAAVRAEYPWAERFVLGLPLPWWQREFEWSEHQCQRFITSAWTGISLGAYVLTEFDLVSGDGVRYLKNTNVVMDGQQRLTALELYFTDRVAVPDVDGKPTLWSELSHREQRWFSNRIFDRGTIRERDEAKLIEYYNLWAFGGTPHKEHQRAVMPG
jgi:hypothetical protein